MNVRAFFDTNILVYAFSQDRRAPRAVELLRSGGVVSVQVLNEFVNVSRGKMKRSWDEIHEVLEQFRMVLTPPIPLTVEIHETAVSLARRHLLEFYDSLIIAAALEAKCDTIFSEDFQHGQKIGNVRIENPFL